MKNLFSLVIAAIVGAALVLGLMSLRQSRKESDEARVEKIIAAQASLVQQQEQSLAAEAEKRRQAQMDSVRALMAQGEKSQRDYLEKQKREQEARAQAERVVADAAEKAKQQIADQASNQRKSAEAKQKEQEERFLAQRPKTPPVAANPAVASGGSAPKITLDAIPLGPLAKDRSAREKTLVITPDGSRVFVAASQGSRVQAVVDGQPGSTCRNIRWLDSRDRYGSKYPFLSPPFSPDNQRVAYIMELDGGKESVVIDSAQSPVYDRVGWLAFGPKGHHVAYIAVNRLPEERRGFEKSRVTMVDNGKAGPVFDDIAHAALGSDFSGGTITFSADGEHLAYVGERRDPGGGYHHRVVIDGRAEPREYGEIHELRISQDGRHFAYVGRNYIRNNMGGGTDQSKVVLDGKEEPPADFIEKLLLSEDGSRCAYVARGNKNDEPSAVVDQGVKGPAFNSIGDIVVSANGRRLGYIAASSNDKSFTVIDNGNKSVPYDECGALSVSNDGSILSFVAKSSLGELLVVNGQEFGPFHDLGNATYSADGKHWACSVHANDSDDSWQFLTDGETHPVPKGARYGGSFKLEFRPGKGWFALALNCELEINTATKDTKVPAMIVYSRDGQHVAKIFASDQGSSHASDQVMLDDKPVGSSSYRVNFLQLSDDGKHIAFVESTGEAGGGRVYFDGKEGAAYERINDLAMTPDGRHVAYSVEEQAKDRRVGHEVVDGFTGPTFEEVLGEGFWSKTHRMSFRPDGSLTFLAGINGQLSRYVYSADGIALIPSMGQTENVSAGIHVLHKFGNFDRLGKCLVLGPNEALYGVASDNGKYGKGTLFTCRTDGSGFDVLHDFYGGDDGGYPKSVVVGKDGNLYGFVDSGLFRYDVGKREYALVTNGETSEGLFGALPDSALLGQQGFHGEWWIIYPAGGGIVDFGPPDPFRYLAAIGPDGAIYSTTLRDQALFRQASVFSEPQLLHKFVDSPNEGKNIAYKVTFDPMGVLYGFTTPESGHHSMVYRMNRDGSDF